MASLKSLKPWHVLVLLGLLLVVAAVAYLTWNARGPWDFVLQLRGRKLWGMALVAYAVAISTVLFQTATGNRILTPAIMGFDALYQLIQTSFVMAFGGLAYLTFEPNLRFVLNAVTMVVLATLLFRWLFGRSGRSLHLLVLVGIVFGVLFRSVSGLMARVINPNDFTVLQDALYANFGAIEPTLLLLSTVLMGLATLALLPVLSRLDVLLLGRDPATSLGVDHVGTISVILVVTAVLVSVSTALVGPVLFFGLLVANLAYLVMPTWRHVYVLPAAVLLALIGLIGGQAILEHGFGYDTALSIIIEFVGGLTFLYLLLRGGKR